MRRPHLGSLALTACASLWLGNACSRASEEELLAGKACASSEDCISGYVCDPAAGVCVRPRYVLTSDPDDTHEDPVGSAGAAGADPGSAGAPSGGAGASSGGAGGIAGSAGASSGGSGAGASGAGSTEAGGSAGNGGNGGDGGNNDASDAGGSDAGTAYAPDAANTPASWRAIAPPPLGFVARQKAAYAVAGDKVLIWGGVDAFGLDLSTGAIYDRSTDTWQLTSVTADTPTGRVLANAAWTGSQFLVWGGRTDDGLTEYKTGALYNPQTQTWTPTANLQTARSGALTLGYSAQVLVWGGWSRTGTVLDKASRYSVAGDSWTLASGDVLGKREHVGWAANGSQLFVAGGRSNLGALLDTAAVYEMGTNSWSTQPALPSARFGLFGAHDGTQFWVWGGRDDTQALGSGLLLGASQWSPTASQGEPSARWAPNRQSGWTCKLQDGRLALWGGHDFADTAQHDGGIYAPATDTWAAIPNASEDHDWGVGACVNGELLVWGGTDGGSVTAGGERWSP
jgi:N-acetylneuraminic acid mutarotase